MDDTLVGRQGRVISDIPAGGRLMGEVMIDGQAYHAYHVDKDRPLEQGTRVAVVEHFPPRTVVVSAF